MSSLAALYCGVGIVLVMLPLPFWVSYPHPASGVVPNKRPVCLVASVKEQSKQTIYSFLFSPSSRTGDYELVENLETTKRTATEIEEKVKEAKITEVKINEARDLYRPAAARASLLYFILNDLNKISPMYQFSLKVRTVPCTSSHSR